MYVKNSKNIDNTENTENKNIEHKSILPSINKISEKTRTRLVICSFVLAVIYEVFAKKRNLMAISVILTFISNTFIGSFVGFGKTFYFVSDQISQIISFEDISVAVYNIFKSVFLLIFSPYNIISGLIEFDSSVELKKSIIVIATGIITLIGVLTLTEIFASKNYKPSILITHFRHLLAYVYESIGQWFLDLSSFYRVMGLGTFVDACLNVCKSIIKTITTPIVSLFKGYFAQLREFEYGKYVISSKSLTLISFGSLTLIGIACYGSLHTDGLFGYFPK